MRDLGSLYFLIRHTFVCATFVSGNKAQVAEFDIAQWYSRAIFYRPETTLAAADSAKAASPTLDITLYYWVSKLHAMSSRE